MFDTFILYKEKFVPIGVLDKFQVAGVFVNWWDNIKYDLKTIMQNGWDAGLIPDDYLIAEFFQKEKTEIETLEIAQSEKETILDEAIEEAINLLELIPEDEETTIPTAKVKEQLKKQIAYVVDEKKKPEEAKPYQEAEKKIVRCLKYCSFKTSHPPAARFFGGRQHRCHHRNRHISAARPPF